MLIPDFSIEEESGKLSSVCFQECLIQRLRIDGTIGADDLPRFHGCYFSAVEGRASKQDLPTAIFDSACVYDDFDATTSTTNAILQMGIPLGAKVLLTILRKLYVQRGSGRRELAFYRGLDHQAQRLVPDILALIKKHGFAVRTKLGEQVVWLPVRSAEVRRRANLIITAPNTVADLLVHECASID